MSTRILKITDKDHSLGNDVLDSFRVLKNLYRVLGKLIIVRIKKVLEKSALHFSTYFSKTRVQSLNRIMGK